MCIYRHRKIHAEMKNSSNKHNANPDFHITNNTNTCKKSDKRVAQA